MQNTDLYNHIYRKKTNRCDKVDQEIYMYVKNCRQKNGRE